MSGPEFEPYAYSLFIDITGERSSHGENAQRKKKLTRQEEKTHRERVYEAKLYERKRKKEER